MTKLVLAPLTIMASSARGSRHASSSMAVHDVLSHDISRDPQGRRATAEHLQNLAREQERSDLFPERSVIAQSSTKFVPDW